VDARIKSGHDAAGSAAALVTTFRRATEADLPAIVRLLADDRLGRTRERAGATPSDAYVAAFRAIERQPGNEVIVAVAAGGKVVGCLQLTIIPGLARAGMTRAQVEAVRIHRDWRGRKLGEAMFRHVIERARAEGCGMVQLTTDKTRVDAHRFYQRLGFVASHEGMKLKL
jgi:ribosomal protein S18 acetylase RimI-like enzyme